jgi:hypothetical protein
MAGQLATSEVKQVVTDFIVTVFNGHDLDALSRFVDNDRLAQAATALVKVFRM